MFSYIWTDIKEFIINKPYIYKIMLNMGFYFPDIMVSLNFFRNRFDGNKGGDLNICKFCVISKEGGIFIENDLWLEKKTYLFNDSKLYLGINNKLISEKIIFSKNKKHFFLKK